MKPSGKIDYDVMLEEISIGLYRLFNIAISNGFDKGRCSNEDRICANKQV